MKFIKLLLITSLLFCSGTEARSKSTPIEGREGIVLIECEKPSYSLSSRWKKKTFLEGFSGECHLEFTGNGIMGGKPTAPLRYKFTVDMDGDYAIFLKGHKRLKDDKGKKARHDLCNDCYIRMDGKFETANDIPLKVLEKDQKFFINSKGSDTGLAWTNTMEYHHPKTHKKEFGRPVYKLKKGEVYSLYISGRSQRFNMDNVVLLHSSIESKKYTKSH